MKVDKRAFAQRWQEIKAFGNPAGKVLAKEFGVGESYVRKLMWSLGLKTEKVDRPALKAFHSYKCRAREAGKPVMTKEEYFSTKYKKKDKNYHAAASND